MDPYSLDGIGTEVLDLVASLAVEHSPAFMHFN
jgi:hypothetical protein